MDEIKRVTGPYRGTVRDGDLTTSPWTCQVTFDDGRRRPRGFPSYSEAAEFVAAHGGSPRAEEVCLKRGRPPGSRTAKPEAVPRPPPARAPTFPLSSITEPTPTDGPAFWIGLLTQTALEVAASGADPLKRGRVLSQLATSARGHQDQDALSRKVAAMEAAFQDMTQAEDYGTATGPSGAYSDSGGASQSDRALS